MLPVQIIKAISLSLRMNKLLTYLLACLLAYLPTYFLTYLLTRFQRSEERLGAFLNDVTQILSIFDPPLSQNAFLPPPICVASFMNYLLGRLFRRGPRLTKP